MPGPSPDGGFDDVSDGSSLPVQVGRRGGARTLILAFCGRHGNLGMPLPIAHRWFGRLDASVLYLRDLDGELYLRGIPALASTRRDTAVALDAWRLRLGAERCLCYGNSTGAYAALLYGLELGAAAVLALNTIAVFPEDRIAMRRSALASDWDDRPPDLASLYAAAPRRPRAHLVFSAGNRADIQSAAAMAGLGNVTTEAIPDHDGHDAHVALVARGRFLPLLLEFENEWGSPAAVGSAS